MLHGPPESERPTRVASALTNKVAELDGSTSRNGLPSRVNQHASQTSSLQLAARYIRSRFGLSQHMAELLATVAGLGGRGR